VQVGKLVKLAADAAAGAATGGLTAAMGLVDSLKGVEMDMTFSKSDCKKRIVKHECGDNQYMFLKIVYLTTREKSGCIGFKRSSLKVTGTIYVTYMEGINESGKVKLQALSAKNADAAIEFIENDIANE